MRVLMVSKAVVVGAYQRKLEELAALPGVDLTVIVPPAWREGTTTHRVEYAYTRGYRLVVDPILFNGRHHLHIYPKLARHFTPPPDVLHVDEEPYNAVTAHALWLARQRRVPALFFTWQNLLRRYPPPFRQVELFSYRSTGYAIAGNHEAAEVLRAKGYRGPVAVIPQFGVDPDVFRPLAALKSAPFRIGYLGRLVPGKGVDTLLRAGQGLGGDWRMEIRGDGESKAALVALAQSLGIAERVEFAPYAPSVEMPVYLNRLDALVLPSRTTAAWKEQFGRILIEAMACGVPVVGSSSGEIPNVIGDAGLVFPEDDAAALRAHLAHLMGDSALAASLGQRGRARVLAHYTHAQVAAATYAIYQELVGLPTHTTTARGARP
ncbi:MAG: glycosyltransferase [Anaerolineae bacterium]